MISPYSQGPWQLNAIRVLHTVDSMTSISFAKFIPTPDSHTCSVSVYPSTMKSWQSAVGHLKPPAKVGCD